MRICNVKIGDIPNCINTSRLFKPSTSDYYIIQYCSEENYGLVTSDVRMTIMALAWGVTVVHVNPTWKKIMCIKPQEFKCDNDEMIRYINERLKK